LLGRCSGCRADRNADHAGRHQPAKTRAVAATDMRAAAKSAATKMGTDTSTAEMRTVAAPAIAKVAATDTAATVTEMRAGTSAADTSTADMAPTNTGRASAVAEMGAGTGRLNRRHRRNSDAHDRCDHPNRYLHRPRLSWFNRKDIGRCARSPHLQDRLPAF
jgi:hypothetical protein